MWFHSPQIIWGQLLNRFSRPTQKLRCVGDPRFHVFLKNCPLVTLLLWTNSNCAVATAAHVPTHSVHTYFVFYVSLRNVRRSIFLPLIIFYRIYQKMDVTKPFCFFCRFKNGSKKKKLKGINDDDANTSASI
jgi:hypothetical protein